MKRIGTVGKTNEIIKNNDFYFKKKFGQNFLIDQNILEGIVNASSITKDVAVIEIGPGIGALTEHLCHNAGKVLAYEIDNNLIPILKNNLDEYDNITVLNKDFLEADVVADIKEYLSDYKEVYLVANLPYYITTPIIMHLLENVKEVTKYTMMMQLEVADRICSNKGKKDYNNLSIVIQYLANVKKALFVSRNVFMPKPNVDSAVVVFDIKEKPDFAANNEKFFFSFVRKSFHNRRKTLVNNINFAYGMPKDEIAKILEENNINPLVRSEALSIEEFVNLANIFESSVTKK
ncbi:MAG: 16S rRNA (adenine(1518)-N(6)/adenine(1519)-N(6))-dimethyltransferase RsmA [bacterium]